MSNYSTIIQDTKCLTKALSRVVCYQRISRVTRKQFAVCEWWLAEKKMFWCVNCSILALQDTSIVSLITKTNRKKQI